MTAQSIIPGILEREQEQSVVYGSIDFGKTVVTHPKYMDLLQKAGSQLKILPHTVINGKDEEVRTIWELFITPSDALLACRFITFHVLYYEYVSFPHDWKSLARTLSDDCYNSNLLTAAALVNYENLMTKVGERGFKRAKLFLLD